MLLKRVNQHSLLEDPDKSDNKEETSIEITWHNSAKLDKNGIKSLKNLGGNANKMSAEDVEWSE